MRRACSLLLPILLASCTQGPDYVRPPVPEPESYREPVIPGESIANLPWWELFEDPVLEDLIAEALENNRDLRASLARIAEARANLGIARADLYPRVNYGADGAITGTTDDEDGPTTSGGVGVSSFYIVDLWGRIRRTNEAALQELLATEEAYRAVTIALVSEVAQAYLLLRDLDNRLFISEQTVDSRSQSLSVVESRFQAGMVSEVDRNQSQIQLYEAEVSVQTFLRLRAQTENALSVLLGSPPMAIERGLPLEEQVFPPLVPAGLPSELLQRRPDVLETERKLHAQTARIGVAEALKFPELTLSANMGASFTSSTLGFLDLGADLFGPLFNSGENQRRVDAEVARTQQLLERYQQSILTAFREVEDALVAVDTYKLEYEARTRQVDASLSAVEMAWDRYDGGMTSYLEVLELERSLFGSQLKRSETLQLQLTSLVGLYQALGGGWVVEQDSLDVFEAPPPGN